MVTSNSRGQEPSEAARETFGVVPSFKNGREASLVEPSVAQVSTEDLHQGRAIKSEPELPATSRYPNWTADDEEFIDGVVLHPNGHDLVRQRAEACFDAVNPISHVDIETEIEGLRAELAVINTQKLEIMQKRGRESAFQVVQSSTRNKSSEQAGGEDG